MPWTLEKALPLICAIESECPNFGCHVGLTGGVLYKKGPRKDLDLVFYRIRQKEIEKGKLFIFLSQLGIHVISKHGWVCKATYRGDDIDILFPETPGNEEYVPTPPTVY